jgi:prepilin-type N-terminal cleavage/methylation domain-containing protein
MEANQMKKGFTLIEVMIAMCILMICIVAFTKMQLVCIHAKGYGERLTRATILGSAGLSSLRNGQFTMQDLKAGWHPDQNNPIKEGNVDFYRFWSVMDVAEGKDVMMYIAWGDKAKIWNFGSLEELNSSPCPRIDLRELLLSLK